MNKLLALIMLGSALWIISDGHRHIEFLTIGYFSRHLSLIITIDFKTIAAQSFQNVDLTSSLTFKFAKADVKTEPRSTLSMWKRFPFFPKSSYKSRHWIFALLTLLFATEDINCLSVTSISTARNRIIGLLV